MKTALFFSLLLAAALHAQEAPSPEPTPAPTEPAVAPAGDAIQGENAAPAAENIPVPTSTSADQGNPLFPEGTLSVDPAASPLDQPLAESQDSESDKPGKKGKSPGSLEEIKKLILFREVKTKALKAPGVQAAWGQSRVAKTEPEKRKALKAYYNALYDQMLKIDDSLANRVENHRTRTIDRLDRLDFRPANGTGLGGLR